MKKFSGRGMLPKKWKCRIERTCYKQYKKLIKISIFKN